MIKAYQVPSQTVWDKYLCTMDLLSKFTSRRCIIDTLWQMNAGTIHKCTCSVSLS